MANEKRLIDANATLQGVESFMQCYAEKEKELTPFWVKVAVQALDMVRQFIKKMPTVDAVEVVRCQNCVHAEPLDRNCEINTCHYMHCKLFRGEETKNVWHKYKKYYKDYSLVERDGYCDAGAKMDGGNEDD